MKFKDKHQNIMHLFVCKKTKNIITNIDFTKFNKKFPNEIRLFKQIVENLKLALEILFLALCSCIALVS